jgi:hypothetical protein
MFPTPPGSHRKQGSTPLKPEYSFGHFGRQATTLVSAIPVLFLPSGHWWQNEALPWDHEPKSHNAQNDEPLSFANDPALHEIHAEEFVTFEYFPGSQLEQYC